GPFFSTVALAGSVLNECASDAQKKKYLAPICRGEARATVAMLESSPNWNLSSSTISAAGGAITGEKLFVSDAAAADFILVVARDGVHVVQAKAAGVTIHPLHGMDMTRKLSSVRFQNTPAEKLANTAGLARALDVATAALAAELVGGM